jgi:hypothetical protein
MSEATLDILGIGNAIVDVQARADDAFLVQRGMDKGAMRLIDADEAEALYAAMGRASKARAARPPTPAPWRRRSAPASATSARSRPTRSAGSSPTTSAPPASTSRPRRWKAAPPPRAA